MRSGRVSSWELKLCRCDHTLVALDRVEMFCRGKKRGMDEEEPKTKSGGVDWDGSLAYATPSVDRTVKHL